MNEINMSEYVVRANGVVDVEATLSNFRSALSTYLAERETQQSTIADAVHAVFDQHKGKSIATPVLANFALRELNVQPENYNTLLPRVMEYIRENSVSESNPQGIFKIVKGKGGGCSRVADAVAAAK